VAAADPALTRRHHLKRRPADPEESRRYRERPDEVQRDPTIYEPVVQ